jgi:Reverse transcriptase (RNA-dependent DNA polymerase)
MLAKIFDKEYKESVLVSTIHDGNPEPKTYLEAKQSKSWKSWQNAMAIEFKNMEDKKVWEIHEKKKLPSGRKLIGNRWVFAQKDDGRYRARTVAKGFSQVPGKDFQENHAPVVNDTTFHLVLALKVLFKLEAGQFDIETAFLYMEI